MGTVSDSQSDIDPYRVVGALLQDVYYLMTAGGVCVTQISAALNSQAYNPPQGSNKEYFSSVYCVSSDCKQRKTDIRWVGRFYCTDGSDESSTEPTISERPSFFNLRSVLGGRCT